MPHPQKPVNSNSPPGTIAWHVSKSPVDYLDANAFMLNRANEIANGRADELIWLLQHKSIYTAGTSARTEELRQPGRFPVLKTGRGGRYTYHGPGQRVVYVLLDLRRRANTDVRRFIVQLQDWAIGTLKNFAVDGQTHSDRVGIWVKREENATPREDKIVAIGIRLKRWVSLHGFSLNVNVDLDHYNGIKPCGIDGFGVTSLEDLGVKTTLRQVDLELRRTFCTQFQTSIEDARSTDTVQKFQ